MTHGLQRDAEEYRPRAPRTIKEIMKVWRCCGIRLMPATDVFQVVAHPVHMACSTCMRTQPPCTGRKPCCARSPQHHACCTAPNIVLPRS